MQKVYYHSPCGVINNEAAKYNTYYDIGISRVFTEGIGIINNYTLS